MDIPRLHPDTIEEVRQRADIYEVVSEHVALKRRGKDYVGLCPFHEEKSPSFTVSPSKQLYYCFGCSAGGGAIKFLTELTKRSFNEAVMDLALRYQVPLKTLEPAQRQELQRQISMREQLYEIMAIATSFYQHALHQNEGRHALEYLQSERRLSEATIQQFQLGYAPAGWETIYPYLVEKKGFPAQLVEQAGLINTRKEGGSYYDRFRDRLIIPICDMQGRVIAFGGRTLSDEQPKYLNSPDTPLFEKGKTLFALDKARAAISKQDRAVVVEGYFDAIALHAAGIPNVVASLGTALSASQIRLLLRYTESKQIVLNFDADKAGNNAAERAIGEVANLAYQGQVQLRVLNLPNGKDADEFLKKSSAERYKILVETAPLWLDWQIQQLLVGKDLSQADIFQQIAQEMVKLLGNINNDNLLIHYTRYCAEVLSQGDSRRISLLENSLLDRVIRHWQRVLKEDNSVQLPLLVANRLKQNKSLQRRGEPKNNKAELPQAGDRELLEQAEALLLRIYLHCPDYRTDVIAALEERHLDFNLSHHRFLWQQILAIETPNIAPELLIANLQDRSAAFPQQMAQVSHLFYLDEKTKQDILRPPLAIRSAAACAQRVMCEKRSRYFFDQFLQNSPANPELARHYQEQYFAEKKRIEQLEKERQASISELLQIPLAGHFSP